MSDYDYGTCHECGQRVAMEGNWPIEDKCSRCGVKLNDDEEKWDYDDLLATVKSYQKGTLKLLDEKGTLERETIRLAGELEAAHKLIRAHERVAVENKERLNAAEAQLRAVICEVSERHKKLRDENRLRTAIELWPCPCLACQIAREG